MTFNRYGDIILKTKNEVEMPIQLNSSDTLLTLYQNYSSSASNFTAMPDVVAQAKKLFEVFSDVFKEPLGSCSPLGDCRKDMCLVSCGDRTFKSFFVSVNENSFRMSVSNLCHSISLKLDNKSSDGCGCAAYYLWSAYQPKLLEEIEKTGNWGITTISLKEGTPFSGSKSDFINRIHQPPENLNEERMIEYLKISLTHFRDVLFFDKSCITNLPDNTPADNSQQKEATDDHSESGKQSTQEKPVVTETSTTDVEIISAPQEREVELRTESPAPGNQLVVTTQNSQKKEDDTSTENPAPSSPQTEKKTTVLPLVATNPTSSPAEPPKTIFPVQQGTNFALIEPMLLNGKNTSGSCETSPSSLQSTFPQTLNSGKQPETRTINPDQEPQITPQTTIPPTQQPGEETQTVVNAALDTPNAPVPETEKPTQTPKPEDKASPTPATPTGQPQVPQTPTPTPDAGKTPKPGPGPKSSGPTDDGLPIGKLFAGITVVSLLGGLIAKRRSQPQEVAKSEQPKPKYPTTQKNSNKKSI